MILGVTCVVRGIEARRGNPSAGVARNGCHIENVIEVSVGDDDAPNCLTLPATPNEFAPQKKAPADKSSVE